MSNKRRASAGRASQQQNLLLLGGFVLAAVAIVVVVAILSSRSGAASNFKPEVAGAPRLSVTQDLVDHGDVKFENYVESVYTVRNVSDQPLIFLSAPKVELIEGC
jgi:hypothetical protein